MSVRARMRRAREAKPPSKQPWLTKLFRDPHFHFSVPPICARSFFRAFCEQYIFDMRVSHLYIPAPYCMHLYLEACYIDDLLQGEDVLAKTHSRYFIKGDFTRGILRMPAKERMFWSGDFRRGKRSVLLPFIIFTPDLKKMIEPVDPLCDMSIAELCLQDTPPDPENMDDNGNWMRDRSFWGIDCDLGYRTEYIYKDPEDPTYYCAMTKEYVPVTHAYIAKNKDVIMTSYFSSFLLSYFKREFGLCYGKKERDRLESWFNSRTKAYSTDCVPFCFEGRAIKPERPRTRDQCRVMKSLEGKT